MTKIDPERLYTEDQAAEVFGLKPRSLRTERTAGRLGYKRVAGRVMFRGRDLIDWFNHGVEPCQDETKDRTSFIEKGAADIISCGPSAAAASDAHAALTIAAKLKQRSRASSATTDGPASGRVIPATFRS